MTTRSLSLVVACLSLAAPAAFAQGYGAEKKPAEKKPAKPAAKATAAAEKPGMAMPKPPAELSQLSFFDGSWTCSGEMKMDPSSPPEKTASAVKAHSGLGGFWQVGTVTMTKPHAFEGMFHTTYDPGQKKFVMVWVDSMGAYSQGTSSGWEGDKLVYAGEGSMMGEKMPMRDTFTKNADGSFKHMGEAQMKGQWSSMGEETCKKAGAAPKKK
jgi:hypothetical protein